MDHLGVADVCAVVSGELAVCVVAVVYHGCEDFDWTF